MKRKIYITTAIDYTNDVIHVGHAYEKILADCVARYERQRRGKENVHYTTGTDEHGTTNQKAAEEKGVDPLTHVKEISSKDKEQIDALNISYDRFIRTTDDDHKKFSADFFRRSLESGDIYLSKYEGYYCDGCEAHKTLSELNEAQQCPNHPNKDIQKLDEENYFFRWSKYNDFLKKMIESGKLIILPEGKKLEMLAFLNAGLKDITVSRPKYKVSWGITTPNDENQVIYVWFDALINYLTEGSKAGFWDEDTEIVHFVGKDIARWHTLLWPAMLKSAGYRLPDKVYVHGFINLNGQKISKSQGNVIYPLDLVRQFGTDGVRYYLLKQGPITEDSDISLDHFKEVYNGELANGLGNTVSRLAKLCERSGLDFPYEESSRSGEEFNELDQVLQEYRVDLALSHIWKKISRIDLSINQKEPWKIKEPEELKKALVSEVEDMRKLTFLLEPFMPETAIKIQEQFNKPKISAAAGLFPRII